MKRVRILAGILLLSTVFTCSLVNAGGETVKKFSLDNGTKVLLFKGGSSEVVAIDIAILGGSANISPETAGLEALWLASALRGSKTYPKEKLFAFMERTGTELFYTVDKDWSVLSMQCLRPFFAEALDATLSVLTEPELRPEEFELVREKLVAAARARKEQPPQLLADLMNQAFYANHPYAADPRGTEDSLAKLSVEQVRQHSKQVLTGSNLVIAVVGNVDESELRSALTRWIGNLPQGSKHLASQKPFTPKADAFPMVNQARLATNYIIGKFEAPTACSREYWALKLGMSILSRMLWDTVRTKQGLSYAVGAGLADNISNYGYIYLETVKPKEALATVRKTLKELIEQGVPQDEFESGKAVFTTRYFMNIEANTDTAGVLVWGELCCGGLNAPAEVLNTLKQLTAADVNSALKKYLTNLKWATLGDPQTLSQVEYFATP